MAKEISPNKISLHVLGCRGSMPVSGPEYVTFGGATSSYLYMTETEAIILDAGTGIMNIPDIGDRNVTILITHTHIDHVLGLPMYIATLGAKEITIAGATHEGLTIRQQLDTYIKRPLWPISLDFFPCKINYVDVKENASAYQIGPVTVTAIPANHPGGSTLYKLEYDGTTLVYATDFEHEELPDDRKDAGLIPPYSTEPFKMLTDFSLNADLVLYDAQYTPEEYPGCKTFGHSTCEKANELRTKANVKEMVLVHHAPSHSDAFLNGMENAIFNIYNCSSNEMRLAREGDEIILRQA